MDQKNARYDDILQTIGGTPLVRLQRVGRDVRPALFAKVEFFNPGGSVKDRIGVHIIEQAERAGLLKPGGTIVESTSGNTGVGLAMVAAVKGYRAIFTMPDKMSREKINLLKAYGAKVVVTPTSVPPDSPESFYEVAKRIVRETPGAFHANQYFNPDNPEIHYRTTGPEIWQQCGGKVDAFVAGMGTGGTISGTGRFLKEKNPSVLVVGADPEGSILREQFETGRHSGAHTYLVEGIGEDMIPGTLDFSVLDRILTISDRDSFAVSRRLAREEGMLCGGSAGTAVAAALQLAREMREDQTIVALIPDTGERYLSKLHNEEWLRDNGMLDPELLRVADVVRAKKVGLPPVVSVRKGGTMRDALALIQAQNVSQLPIVDDQGRVEGTLVEGTLLKKLLEGEAHLEDPVTRLAEAPLPRIPSDAPVRDAARMLADRLPALLVEERGEIVGILTRFDLIEYIAR
ncbi:MAG: cystathionine beta-synthase [Candidatus Eisenbacteria bacterium]|nr:cystathionine beta-synthase [Candidatus Eisenbacteria bacterium]